MTDSKKPATETMLHITVVEADDADRIEQLFHAPQHPSLKAYIRGQFEYEPATLINEGRAFFAKSKALAEDFIASTAWATVH